MRPTLTRHALAILLPILNIGAAFLCAGLVVLAIGENPFNALGVLIDGAFGGSDVIGYTLYYATDYIFAGLAVALAFHGGLFNIGADGQAYLGGLGVALACLLLGDRLPWPLLLPVAIAAAMVFGAAWAWLPGYLQARTGSHVVVTTIMFNFIANALMNYLLVDVLIAPGQESPQTREFAAGAALPMLHEMAAGLGITLAASPANLSLLLALGACALFQLYVWRSRDGYALRVMGTNPGAARYAGIRVGRKTVFVMCLSGALAGLVAINEVEGANHHLATGFTGGAGFIGLAVALMGRNKPLGICLSALLFGALTQGGTELSLEIPKIDREMGLVIEGLIILFCGALQDVFRRPLTRACEALGWI
jgi:general nucleoside transport system permease protein